MQLQAIFLRRGWWSIHCCMYIQHVHRCTKWKQKVTIQAMLHITTVKTKKMTTMTFAILYHLIWDLLVLLSFKWWQKCVVYALCLSQNNLNCACVEQTYLVVISYMYLVCERNYVDVWSIARVQSWSRK